jgi:hypothetical protein
VSYHNWISGIYNTYDGIFKHWESQDYIRHLELLLEINNLKHLVYDDDGNQIWKPTDEYEGFKRSKTTEGQEG